MERPLPSSQKQPSVWSEYLQKGAEYGLYGLSFFFSLPKQPEDERVKVLEGLSWSEANVVGEIDVRRIVDVVHTAMAPLKSMFVKGMVLTAALFFSGRALSILPFVPAICYLFGFVTLGITHDIYRAQQQMKYTFTHFNTRAMVGADRMEAMEAARIIDMHAQQSLCDMLFFGEDQKIPRFSQYMASLVEKEEGTLDPYMITQMFFPALATIYRVAQTAKAFTGNEEHKHL